MSEYPIFITSRHVFAKLYNLSFSVCLFVLQYFVSPPEVLEIHQRPMPCLLQRWITSAAHAPCLLQGWITLTKRDQCRNSTRERGSIMGLQFVMDWDGAIPALCPRIVHLGTPHTWRGHSHILGQMPERHPKTRH